MLVELQIIVIVELIIWTIHIWTHCQEGTFYLLVKLSFTSRPVITFFIFFIDTMPAAMTPGKSNKINNSLLHFKTHYIRQHFARKLWLLYSVKW